MEQAGGDGGGEGHGRRVDNGGAAARRRGLVGEAAAWGRRAVAESAELPLEALRFLGLPHRRRRVSPPPGSAPGERATSAHAVETRIRTLVYDREACEEREIESADELADVIGRPGRVVWIDVTGFQDDVDLERIREVLDIHPLALADVVHVPQRPKAELYGNRLLIITQMARLTDEGEIEVEQVSLVLGPGWVVTFQEQPGDVFDPVRNRIRSPTTRIRRMGADYLAYALVDAVVDGYFPVVEAIGGVLEALEEEVLDAPGQARLVRIHATRRLLLHLHRVQWRQRDAINTLVRDETFPFSDPVRVFLRDAYDHAFHTLDALETYRDMVVGLMDVYLSSTSNRLNEVMKTLTIMASIFIPLTFLTGVYGMNFEYMPELHKRWAYPAVWGVMIATVVGLLWWFRSRGWLGDGDR